MIERLLIDTGPLLAILNRRDRLHEWVQKQLADVKPPLLTCEAVLSEACFLLHRQNASPEVVLGLVENRFIEVALNLNEEASRVHEIMARYANVPASLADACLVRMAEIHAGSRLLSFDSDFQIYRIHGRKVLPAILPPT